MTRLPTLGLDLETTKQELYYHLPKIEMQSIKSRRAVGINQISLFKSTSSLEVLELAIFGSSSSLSNDLVIWRGNFGYYFEENGRMAMTTVMMGSLKLANQLISGFWFAMHYMRGRNAFNDVPRRVTYIFRVESLFASLRAKAQLRTDRFMYLKGTNPDLVQKPWHSEIRPPRGPSPEKVYRKLHR